MISIIVPIYKVEKFIDKCIESICSQTYKDIEIILVDDGSPDNCSEICDNWAKQDERIKVVHKENGGLVSARKAGFRASHGEYVCFVDGDDWIEPDMYEHINNSIEKYAPDCVITQFYYSYPTEEIKSDYKLDKELYIRQEIEKDIFPTMLFDNQYYKFGIYPCCWTKVFKRKLLEKHLLDTDERIRMGEDIAFTYPCLMECQSIAFIDKPLYHYRSNPDSMTSAYDPILQDIIFLPYETLVKKCNELGVDLSKQLSYYFLYLVNFVIRNEASPSNPKSKAKTREILSNLLDYNDMNENVKSIDYSLLPLHTKFLATILRTKNVFLLQVYIKLLRKYL